MNKQISLTLVATALLALAGCKKDSVEPPANTTPTETAVDATVAMHFNFKDGSAPFVLGTTVLHDSLGHSVLLEQVRFFVSSLHAFDDGGNVLAHYEGNNLLVDAAHADTTYTSGAIHASHIHEFHFDLGLDPTTNASDPATAAPPLNDTSMYFNGMAMGYKFLVATGHADLDNNGSHETQVHYACGMDALLTEGHAHVHHDLSAGELFTAQIDVNLGLLFQGIDLALNNAPTMDAPASQRMMTNLSEAIDGEE